MYLFNFQQLIIKINNKYYCVRTQYITISHSSNDTIFIQYFRPYNGVREIFILC